MAVYVWTGDEGAEDEGIDYQLTVAPDGAGVLVMGGQGQLPIARENVPRLIERAAAALLVELPGDDG